MYYSLSRKVTLVAFSMLAALLIAALAAFANLNRAHLALDHLATVTFRQMELSEQFDVVLNRSIIDAKAYGRTQERERYRLAVDLSRQAHSLAGELSALATSEAAGAADQAVNDALEQRRLRLLELTQRELTTLLEAAGERNATRVAQAGERLSILQEAFERLEQDVDATLQADIARSHHTLEALVWRGSVLSLGAFGLLTAIIGIGTITLRRHIITPINTLVRAADRVAAGHLDQQVPITSRDELGLLQAAFNHMVDDLRARHNALTQQSQGQYFRLAADGTILDYQAGNPDELFKPPGELLGRHLRDVLPSDAYEKLDAARAQVAGGSPGVTVEYDLAVNDERHVYEARLLPFAGSELLVVVRNITARKHAEARLRASEELYRALFEQASDAIVLETDNDTIVDVNARACALFGYSRDELLALKISDLQAPEVRRAASQSVVASELERYAGAPFETLGLRRDGTRVAIEISNARVQGQEHGIVLAIVRDISGRKRAEQEQRLVADVAKALAGTLDYGKSLAQVAQLMLPLVGDWCLISVAGSGHAASRGALAHHEPLLHQALQRISHTLTTPALLNAYLEQHSAPTTLVFRNLYENNNLGDLGVVEVYRQLLNNLHPAGLMLTPITARDETFGLILFGSSNRSRPYTSTDVQLAEELAHRIALAVDTSLLYYQVQRHLTELTTIQTVARTINSALQLDLLFTTVVTQIREAFGYQLVSTYLCQGDALRLQAAVGYDQVPDEIRLDQGVSGRVARTGRPVFIEDATVEPDFLSVADGACQYIGIPLRTGANQVLGLLIVESTGQPALTNDDFILLKMLGDQMSTAVTNARLYTTLRESQLQYQSVVDHVEEVIFQTDAEGHWTFLNPAWTRITGFKLQESLGVPFLEFVHPDDRQRNYELFLPLIERKKDVCHHEIRYLTRDGGFCWIEVQARLTLSPDGTMIGTSGTLTDVTARKRAEIALHEANEMLERRVAERTQKLHEAELRYRTLVEQIPAIIYISALDQTMNIRYVSPQIELFLGYTPEEWVANPGIWLACIHPDDREHMRAEAARARADGMFKACEYRLIARDGRVVWFRDEGVVIADAAGQALYTQGVMLDITTRKAAEAALVEERAQLAERVVERTAELSHANAELARAARLKDEFLASMSHELRTPLNTILGMAESLQEQLYGPLTADQAEAVRSVEESGRHLLALINDILDLSKVEAGKLKLDLDLVDLEGVCQASLRMIKQSAQQKRLNVSSRIEDAIPPLLGDSRRLKQILVNLLNNAVKFTPEGGSIGLEVQADAVVQVVYFVVWDTGIGIDTSDLKRLFKPFVQLDSRLSRQYAGTGLGLALVQRMVELHGGSVTVTSTPGQGSRFTIALPITAPPALELENDRPVEVPARAFGSDELLASLAARRPIVLLAEDHQNNTRTISQYLTARGCQMVVVPNGLEAVEQTATIRPHIILMDIQMPEMDGLEAIRRIKADAELASIPIIALTALSMPGDRERCLEAGADEYLSKPVRLRELALLIAATLEHPTRGEPV